MASNRSPRPRFSRSRFASAGLALAFSLLAVGCLQHELVTGLSERESQEIIVLLKERGLEATRQLVAQEREAPSWTVLVKGGDQNLVTAWRVLQENGLPRPPVKGLEEMFAESGMIPTPAEERAKMLVGLAGELSRTLRSIDGVVDARVHLVLPEDNPLIDKDERPRPSASVLVKYKGEKPPVSERDVLRLVAKGIEGLEESDIAVVFLPVKQSPVTPRAVSWYLGNQEILVAALGLLGLLAVVTLVLLVRLRSQTAQIRKLQQLLSAASEAPQLEG